MDMTGSLVESDRIRSLHHEEGGLYSEVTSLNGSSLLFYRAPLSTPTRRDGVRVESARTRQDRHRKLYLQIYKFTVTHEPISSSVSRLTLGTTRTLVSIHKKRKVHTYRI